MDLLLLQRLQVFLYNGTSSLEGYSFWITQIHRCAKLHEYHSVIQYTRTYIHHLSGIPFYSKDRFFFNTSHPNQTCPPLASIWFENGGS